jgi:hypothetical protein
MNHILSFYVPNLVENINVHTSYSRKLTPRLRRQIKERVEGDGVCRHTLLSRHAVVIARAAVKVNVPHQASHCHAGQGQVAASSRRMISRSRVHR